MPEFTYQKSLKGKMMVIVINSDYNLRYSKNLDLMLKENLKNSSLETSLRYLCDSYLSHNADELIQRVRDIAEPALFHLLEKSFLSQIVKSISTINITYGSGSSNLAGNPPASVKIDISSVSINFNLDSPYFWAEILEFGEKALRFILLHELTHIFLKRDFRARKSLPAYSRYITPALCNLYFMIEVLILLKCESATTMLVDIEKFGRVKFNMSSVKALRKIYEEASTGMELEATKLALFYAQEDHIYNVGEMMLATIILNELLEKGKAHLIWLKYNNILKIRNEINATRIGKIYGKKDFDMIFYDSEKSIYKIIEETVIRLRKVNYFMFLKVYEAACRKLKITPFFSVEEYIGYKKKYWKNYQKTLKGKE